MISFTGGTYNASHTHRTGKLRSFSKLIDYLHYGDGPKTLATLEKRVLFSGTQNLPPLLEPEAIAHQMTLTAELSKRIQKPVYHIGVSLEPGERLTRDQWEYVVDSYLTKLGLKHRHQALWVVHDDTDHQHVHIAVNRVSLRDGRVWEPHRDREIRFRLALQLESELGLGRTASMSTPSSEYVPDFRSNSERTLLEQLRRQLPLFDDATNWLDLEDVLSQSGAYLIPASRGSGLIITNGHSAISASKLARRYSAPSLTRRFEKEFKEHRADHPLPPLDRVLTSRRPTFTRGQLQKLALTLPSDPQETMERILERSVEVAARRYTTRAYAAAESALLRHSEALTALRIHALAGSDVKILLRERYPYLSPEQSEAVLEGTVGADLGLIAGRAGAGKTTLTAAIVDAYRDAGYTVEGAALTGKAARGLQDETGITARTLAALFAAWERGATPTSRTVLVVDEATLLSTFDLERLLLQTRRSEAKILLLGDTAQLQPLGPGEAFRGLLERYEHAGVHTVRRQRPLYLRRVSHFLAHGRVDTALDLLEARGFIHAFDSDEDAALALAHAYLEIPERERALVLAAENAHVEALNQTVRHLRFERGELNDPRSSFQVGERVLFTQNDYDLDTRNGQLGTVEERTDNRLHIRLDVGRTLEVPETYSHIDYGYALTTHKAQGVTVDHAFVFAGHYDRHGATTALTRSRESVDLFYSQGSNGAFKSYASLKQRFGRAGQNHLLADFDVERQAILPAAPALSEWHFLHPTIEPHAPGLERPPLAGGPSPASTSLLAELDRHLTDARHVEHYHRNAGLFRLPGAVPTGRAREYAELQRSILRTTSAAERSAKLGTLGRLLTPRSLPSEPTIDAGAAWERLRKLAATSHSTESPVFREASHVAFHTIPETSARHGLVRRFLTHESADAGTDLLEALRAQPLKERLPILELNPEEAVRELPRLDLELRRALAESHYRHNAAAELGNAVAMEQQRRKLFGLAEDHRAVERSLAVLELQLLAQEPKPDPLRLERATKRYATASLFEPYESSLPEAFKPAVGLERETLHLRLEHQLRFLPSTQVGAPPQGDWAAAYLDRLAGQDRFAVEKLSALGNSPFADVRRFLAGDRLPDTLDRLLKHHGIDRADQILAPAQDALLDAEVRLKRYASSLAAPEDPRKPRFLAALRDYRAAQWILMQDAKANDQGASRTAAIEESHDDLIARTQRLLPALGSLESWEQLETTMASSGLFLLEGRVERSLLVADRHSRVASLRIHPSLELERLEARFGQSYTEHRSENERPYLLALTVRKPAFTERELKRLMLALGDPPETSSEVLRNAVKLDEAHYTLPEIQALEQRLFDRAEALTRISFQSFHAFPRERVRAAVAPTLPDLDPRAQDALFRAVENPLGLIAAQPGAQKDQLVDALCLAYGQEGYKVRALSWTRSGVESLQKRGLEDTTTLVSQLFSWEKAAGSSLRVHPLQVVLSSANAAYRFAQNPASVVSFAARKTLRSLKRSKAAPTLLVVDQAHQIDLPSLEKLFAEVEKRPDTKLVLIGEPSHPDAAAFRGLLERHPSQFLEGPTPSWQVEASRLLALGRSGAALDLHEAHGAITAYDGREDAIRDTVSRFLEDPHNARLLSTTAAEAEALNQEARRQLTAAGYLEASKPFQPNEPVYFRGSENTPSGSGRVVFTTESEAIVVLERPLQRREQVTVPLAAIRYDYARSLRQAAGETTERAFLFVGRSSPETGYLALSAHSDRLHVAYDRDTYPSYAALRRALISPMPSLASDHLSQKPSRTALNRLDERELMCLNRGLDPQPITPLSSKAIDPLVHRFSQLRARQNQLSAAQETPLRPLERLRVDRQLAQAADDLYFALGAERLPGAISFDRAAAYATERRRALDLSLPAAERREASHALDNLLSREIRVKGDPLEAWNRLERLATGPYAPEHPDFRQAAAIAYANDPDTSSDRFQALRRWMTQEHPERAEELLRHLVPHSSPARTLPSLATDAELVQSAHEARLALRHQKRRLEQLSPSALGTDAERELHKKLHAAKADLHRAHRHEAERFRDRFAQAATKANPEALEPYLAELDRALRTLAETDKRLSRPSAAPPSPEQSLPEIHGSRGLAERAEAHVQAALQTRQNALESFPKLPTTGATYDIWHESFTAYAARVEELAAALDRNPAAAAIDPNLERLAAGDRSQDFLASLAERFGHRPLEQTAATPEDLIRAERHLDAAARSFLQQRSPTAQLTLSRALADYRSAAHGLPLPHSVTRAVPAPGHFLKQAGGDRRRAAFLWAQAAGHAGVSKNTIQSALGRALLSSGSAVLTIGGKAAAVIATAALRKGFHILKEAVLS